MKVSDTCSDPLLQVNGNAAESTVDIFICVPYWEEVHCNTTKQAHMDQKFTKCEEVSVLIIFRCVIELDVEFRWKFCSLMGLALLL